MAASTGCPEKHSRSDSLFSAHQLQAGVTGIVYGSEVCNIHFCLLKRCDEVVSSVVLSPQLALGVSAVASAKRDMLESGVQVPLFLCRPAPVHLAGRPKTERKECRAQVVDNDGPICQSTWARGRAEASRAGDICAEFHEFQQSWRGCLAAKKVKSHAIEADFASGALTVSEAIANEAADVYADRAAAELEVNSQYARDIL